VLEVQTKVSALKDKDKAKDTNSVVRDKGQGQRPTQVDHTL